VAWCPEPGERIGPAACDLDAVPLSVDDGRLAVEVVGVRGDAEPRVLSGAAAATCLWPVSAVAQVRGGVADESACKPGSVPAGLRLPATAIHLESPLPATSSGLPGSSGGPPSNAPCLTLLRVGFTEPGWSPSPLVVSYTTVSPLPAGRSRPAVCFLWHCPAGHPGSVLPTTLPCGARTFLGSFRCRDRPADSSATVSVRRAATHSQ